MEQLTNFQELLSIYGFPAVFFLIFMEMVGIPFPAETILIFVGATFHESDLYLLMIFAFSGHVLGSTCGYWLGYYLGRGILVRYGPYVKITEDKLARAEELFMKYKISIIAFAKFLAVVRILIPFIAGINRMPFWSFTLINTISAAVWVVTFITLGHFAGKLIMDFKESLLENIWFILLGGILLIGAIWYYRRWKKLRIENKNNASSV